MNKLREYFPYFDRYPEGVAYLDTASSALKLRSTIQRMSEYLSYEHANVHRGAYRLSADATINYEAARQIVKNYFNLSDEYSVVFTSGATDSINLVSYGVERSIVNKNDAILTTAIEHHSNFVPWQELAKRIGGKFIVSPIRGDATIDEEEFIRLVNLYTPKIVALTAHSNAFGTLPNISKLVKAAKESGALVLLDVTQSVVHGRSGLFQNSGADFFAFSAHKMYGPTGLGVLVAKSDSLDKLSPFRYGGGMIRRVEEQNTTYADLPERFEAGTPPIAEVIAFGETLRTLQRLFLEHDIEKKEAEIFQYAYSALKSADKIKVIGPDKISNNYRSIISFEIKGVHPHDVASIADTFKVQIRAGHHCCMPAMQALGVQSTVRMSLGLYSCKEDIDKLLEALDKASSMF